MCAVCEVSAQAEERSEHRACGIRQPGGSKQINEFTAWFSLRMQASGETDGEYCLRIVAARHMTGM